MSNFINIETQKIVQEITNEIDPHRILSLWACNKEKLKGVRLLTQVNSFDSKLLPKHLEKKEFEGKSKAFLQEFYQNRNLFVLSNEILDAHHSSAILKLPIDYSLLFDSNYIGSIDLFLRGMPVGNNYDALTKSMHYILSNKLNCDALPYLFENIEHITERREDVTRSFANFLRISSATPKSECIRTPDDLTFKLSEADSLDLAKQRILNFYDDKEALENHILRQKTDFYIILSMIHIEHHIKGSLSEKFSALITIMHSEIRGVALRELTIAYKYFKNNNSIFILANLGKLIKESNSSIKAIRNISWDFHFFRLMETWASDTSKAAFFIPMFVTLDKRLANLNEIYLTKYSVFHDIERKMYTVPALDIRSQIDNKACRLILEDYFTPQKRSQRANGTRLSSDALEEKIKKKGSELDAIFLATK
ncbi:MULTISPECIES: hypothetical protein [unclassified Pseudomonas]|uniref:hypothetical protein n=1 Tax=unclassified Pseudomonas TaxID=196821 RepID=UPI000C87CD3F|nr:MULTISPECIES: hypothetical protein [unclassified Pseudomonas]PMU10197.1 hypothetical protein C1Y11_12665 [Pseudomonas sp. FW305-20]PMU19061.1 hypothetical protein C1Y10_11080 [Pseudomonas sp. FW305-122]PMU42377.1 hypothetical protein C1Y12_05240 [Pseudomonas sp. FW305-47B]PMX62764.1 hypothetical protein C1Y13_08460 [Pseudomonas sp. FW305-33]PMX68028.1 hypothetical protein C1X12_12280 [Pseudomonas sp. FW305-60]